ncbi:MAG TPA: DUF5714 domain-containing protein [Methanocorpusculum sp.]|nr:DUF5714 domain-containing protein [Methanocorpusculum sp.]
MSYENGCILCGDEIIYLDSAKKQTCAVCGKEFESNAVCRMGHYVCDTCHSEAAYAVIKYVCLSSTSKNPVEIMEEIIKSPAVHVHGPEYHVIVSSVLLTAYHNAGGKLDLESALTAAKMRGMKIIGGFCGLAGACGAGIASGIFLSIALKTNPLSEKNWGLGMQLTSACLGEIGKCGGPRCCRRDSLTSIKTTAEFVKKEFGIGMELPEKIVCRHSADNHECLKEKCPYFPTKDGAVQ